MLFSLSSSPPPLLPSSSPVLQGFCVKYNNSSTGVSTGINTERSVMVVVIIIIKLKLHLISILPLLFLQITIPTFNMTFIITFHNYLLMYPP